MTIIQKWWNKGNKQFSITYNRKSWKAQDIKPKYLVFTNGGKKKNGDTCFDFTIIIGYTIINYTNFNLGG